MHLNCIRLPRLVEPRIQIVRRKFSRQYLREIFHVTFMTYALESSAFVLLLDRWIAIPNRQLVRDSLNHARPRQFSAKLSRRLYSARATFWFDTNWMFGRPNWTFPARAICGRFFVGQSIPNTIPSRLAIARWRRAFLWFFITQKCVTNSSHDCSIDMPLILHHPHKHKISFEIHSTLKNPNWLLRIQFNLLRYH